MNRSATRGFAVKGLGLSVIAMLFVMGYLFNSSPQKVVTNEFGKVSGLQNIIRKSLQGGFFWREQCSLARKEERMLRDFPEKQRRLELSIDKIIDRYRKSSRQDRSIKTEHLPEYVLRQQRYIKKQQERDSAASAGADILINTSRKHRIAELMRIIDYCKSRY
jgi:hypothetical protein